MKSVHHPAHEDDGSTNVKSTLIRHQSEGRNQTTRDVLIKTVTSDNSFFPDCSPVKDGPTRSLANRVRPARRVGCTRGWMPSLRLPDIGSQLEPGNPTPGAHTTGALGHASMLAAPASGRVAVLAPRRQARRVVARRVAVARALDGAGDELRDESRGDDRPVDAEARVAAPCLARPEWRTALGTVVSCAALSAGARTPPALAVADAGVGASASVSSRDARADRGASLPAELLARTHAADASRIADVGFLPAAVGIPRTGWFVGSWIAGNAAGIQKQCHVDS